MDPHEVLGVAPDAPEEEVRAAYRALVRRHHPDRHVDKPEEVQAAEAARMAEVTGAFQLLNDPVALARHRASQARVGRPPGAASGSPAHPGGAPDDPAAFDYRRAAPSEFEDLPGGGRWGRTPPPPARRQRTGRSHHVPGTRRRRRGLVLLGWVVLVAVVVGTWLLVTGNGAALLGSTVVTGPATPDATVVTGPATPDATGTGPAGPRTAPETTGAVRDPGPPRPPTVLAGRSHRRAGAVVGTAQRSGRRGARSRG